MMTFFHSENKTIYHKEYDPVWKQHPSAQSQFLDIQLQDTNANKWVRAFFFFWNLLIFIWSFHFTEYTWSKKEKQTNKQNKRQKKRKEKKRKTITADNTTSKLIESTYLKIYVQYLIVSEITLYWLTFPTY